MFRQLFVLALSLFAATASLLTFRTVSAQTSASLDERLRPYATGQAALRICVAENVSRIRVMSDGALWASAAGATLVSTAETGPHELVFTIGRGQGSAYYLHAAGFSTSEAARETAAALTGEGFTARQVVRPDGQPVVVVEGTGGRSDAVQALQRVCRLLPAGVVAVVMPPDSLSRPNALRIEGWGSVPETAGSVTVTAAAGRTLRFRYTKPDAAQGVVEGAYRGRLELQPRGAAIQAVNLVPLEEYLLGVVGTEMSTDAPSAALQAQAIIARTYALANLGRFSAQGYDLTNDTRSQGYRGLAAEAPAVTDAVAATRGKVLTVGGALAPCAYSTCCGGCTAAAENVWGAALSGCLARLDQPGARAAPSLGDEASLRQFILNPPASYCRDDRRYRWRQRYTATELQALLETSLPRLVGVPAGGLGRLLDVRVSARASDGRATSVVFVGSKASYSIQRDNIRWAFGAGKVGGQGLYSTLFAIDKRAGSDGVPAAYEVFGGGWGHGTGLCQSGAIGMARQGRSAVEILSHYYQGGRLADLL